MAILRYLIQTKIPQAALMLLAGTYWATTLSTLPNTYWLIWLIPLIWLIYRLHHLPIVWLSGFCLIGLLWTIFRASFYGVSALPATLEGHTLKVSGTITSIPQVHAQHTRFDLLIDDNKTYPWVGKIRLSWYHPEQALQAGQRWQLAVRLKRPHGFANPGGFDYEAWLYEQRIGATGYVRNTPSPQLLGQQLTLNYWRSRLSQTLHQALAGQAVAGLLIALATGDRQYIDDQQWQVLIDTGTNHLMAISGLHIGLVFGLFYWLGKRAWRMSAQCCLRLPAPDVGMLIGLLGAIAYAAMAGFAIPTQRALMMLAVLVASHFSRRWVRPIGILMLALILVLFFDPLSVLSSSFWLSFSAVFFILLFLDAHRQSNTPYWMQFVLIQLVVTLGLIPLLGIWFNRISLIGPVANLLAVPVVSIIIVPMVLLGTLAIEFIPYLASQWLTLGAFIMQQLWAILTFISELPGITMDIAQPAGWAVGIALIGILMGITTKQLKLRLLGITMVLVLFIPTQKRLQAGEFRLDFMDVGQGLAVLVHTASHHLLYDTGFYANPGFNAGTSVILPYLRYAGISQLDKVILSHDDKDHTGGFPAIQKNISIGEVWHMPHSSHTQATTRTCQAQQAWQWDGVNFEILFPSLPLLAGHNNRSCVLRITNGQSTALLTGDIEKSAERILQKKYASQLHAQVVSSPHHGSNTSSTIGFINALDADHVVHSAGYRNRFGFPKPQVVDRYRQAHTQQWRTDLQGMVSFMFRYQQTKPDISIYRDRIKRFWRKPLVADRK